MRILFAEENAVLRQELAKRLQTLGHTLTESIIGNELLASCRQNVPDLIIIGNKLGPLNCWDLSKQIRQLGGELAWTPIWLFSNNIAHSLWRDAFNSEIDEVLNYDLLQEKLLFKLKVVARNKAIREELFTIAHNLVVNQKNLLNSGVKDILTNLVNAASFNEELQRRWSTAKQEQSDLALILLNLDYFQAFNQLYGAIEGDKCIKKVAEIITVTVNNPKYTVARLYGETFAILLPKVKLNSAINLALELQQALIKAAIPNLASGSSNIVTASFGVAAQGASDYLSAKELSEAADFALYQAKHSGRNKIVNG